MWLPRVVVVMVTCCNISFGNALHMPFVYCKLVPPCWYATKGLALHIHSMYIVCKCHILLYYLCCAYYDRVSLSRARMHPVDTTQFNSAVTQSSFLQTCRRGVGGFGKLCQSRHSGATLEICETFVPSLAASLPPR